MHLSLAKDAPTRGVVQPAEKGLVIALKWVGGLNHLYTRMAVWRLRCLNGDDTHFFIGEAMFAAIPQV